MNKLDSFHGHREWKLLLLFPDYEKLQKLKTLTYYSLPFLNYKQY